MEDRRSTRQHSHSDEADSSTISTPSGLQTTSEDVEVTFDTRGVISFEDNSHHHDFARIEANDDHTTDSSSPIINIRCAHSHHTCISRKVMYALMITCVLLLSFGTYFIIMTDSNKESASATSTSEATTPIEPFSSTMEVGEDVDDSSMTGGESFEEVGIRGNEGNPNDELPLSSPLVDKSLRDNSANDTSCEEEDDKWFELELTTDSNGNETSWELEVMKDGEWRLLSVSKPHESNTHYVVRLCIEPADYKFTIRDAGNDGMCYNNGCGSYAGYLLPWGRIFESPIGDEDWEERTYNFTLYSISSNTTTTTAVPVPSASPPNANASMTLFPAKDESSLQTTSPSLTPSMFAAASMPPTLSSSNQDSLLTNTTSPLLVLVPSQSPTAKATDPPSQFPSDEPTSSTSMIPSTEATSSPSQLPSEKPTGSPSQVPTAIPTSLPSLHPTVKPSPQPTPRPTTWPSRVPPTNDAVTKFFLVADCPYDDKERQQTMPQYIEGLENDGDFLVHLGDLMNAAIDRCRERAYISAAQVLQRARMPTFVLPGDNDMNDCPSIQHGEAMWMKYFHLFDKKFWSHSFDIRRWGKLQESFAFVHKRVMFLGLNMIGGIPYNWSEKSERHRNHLEQVKALFNEYEGKFDVIVLMKHADPNLKTNYHHTDFFGTGRGDGLFIDLIRQMGKPTIHFHGDSHVYYEREADHGVSNYMRISLVGESNGPPLSVTIDVSKPNPITVSRRQSNLKVSCCANGWPRL